MRLRVDRSGSGLGGAQGGVGLIEVVIAMLVLAIGLLGLVKMQLAAKQASFEAAQRTVATSLARDLLERMRSNPGQLSAYGESEPAEGGGSPAQVSCAPVACTPAQLALYDLYDWYQSLQGAAAQVTVGGVTANTAGLVAPRACISSQGGDVEVVIAWRGVHEMPPPDTSAPRGSDCGQGEGLYGEGDRYRRLLVMSTFIGTS